MVQSLLFFEAAAHHWLSISTIFMAVVPIIYLFCALSPMIVSGCKQGRPAGGAGRWRDLRAARLEQGGAQQDALVHASPQTTPELPLPHLQSAHMYEFVAFFLPWYISNRWACSAVQAARCFEARGPVSRQLWLARCTPPCTGPPCSTSQLSFPLTSICLAADRQDCDDCGALGHRGRLSRAVARLTVLGVDG